MLKKETMTAQEFEATLTEQLNRKHKLEYENAEVDEFLTAFRLKDCSGMNFAGRKFAPETSLRGGYSLRCEFERGQPPVRRLDRRRHARRRS